MNTSSSKTVRFLPAGWLPVTTFHTAPSMREALAPKESSIFVTLPVLERCSPEPSATHPDPCWQVRDGASEDHRLGRRDRNSSSPQCDIRARGKSARCARTSAVAVSDKDTKSELPALPIRVPTGF